MGVRLEVSAHRTTKAKVRCAVTSVIRDSKPDPAANIGTVGGVVGAIASTQLYLPAPVTNRTRQTRPPLASRSQLDCAYHRGIAWRVLRAITIVASPGAYHRLSSDPDRPDRTLHPRRHCEPLDCVSRLPSCRCSSSPASSSPSSTAATSEQRSSERLEQNGLVMLQASGRRV